MTEQDVKDYMVWYVGLKGRVTISSNAVTDPAAFVRFIASAAKRDRIAVFLPYGMRHVAQLVQMELMFDRITAQVYVKPDEKDGNIDIILS